MENFDYKKYLKNNPLLKEGEFTEEDMFAYLGAMGFGEAELEAFKILSTPEEKIEYMVKGGIDQSQAKSMLDQLKEDLGRTGDSWGYEGGGIPDSDIEHDDHEHDWEDTGDEEGMFTGEEECKICGLRRSVYDGDKKFKDYEGPSIEDVASRPENIGAWTPSDQKEGDLFEKKITKSQLKEAIKRIINEKIRS